MFMGHVIHVCNFYYSKRFLQALIIFVFWDSTDLYSFWSILWVALPNSSIWYILKSTLSVLTRDKCDYFPIFWCSLLNFFFFSVSLSFCISTKTITFCCSAGWLTGFYKWKKYMIFVLLWLLSLSIMNSSPTRAASTGKLFMAV